MLAAHRRPLSALYALALSSFGCAAREGPQPGTTRVLVVGTIHGQHRRNPNYSYEDVVRILDAWDPDVVGVEIRPSIFRREPYLKEMMLAAVWGIAHQREVFGFDWYDEASPDREVRARLEREPEYVVNARRLDSLIAANPVTAAFNARYGDFWPADSSYEFYNGAAYNRYFEEEYRLSLAVYGDSPINLHYEQRNRRMMDLAWEAIRRHPGWKVVLLTGAEHKHYFDRELGAADSVEVVQLPALLPLATRPQDRTVRAFLDDDDDLPYYIAGYPADTAHYFENKMVGLVHGPDMDWQPDIIPRRNVEVAARVLDRWRATLPASPVLTFNQAWVDFLNDDCDSAVARLTGLAAAVESGEVHDWFLRAYTYRNLGLCDDLLGRREDALRAYARARAILRESDTPRSADLALRDYETVPYARGRSAQPW